MELNEYQEKAMMTCMPSCENVSYMLLNLVGEVGELAGLCSVLGWGLDDVAQENLDKLKDRKNRGVIDGSGDNR